VATSIDQQLSGAPVTPAVRSRWWDTAYALGFVLAVVAPAAERVRQQVERVRPLVRTHETELPRPLLDGWEKLSGWVRLLGKP